MLALYDAIFYRPIFNLLVFLYDVVPGGDIGVAIIILTVLIKLVLWPLSAKALKSQRALAEIQPKVAELKLKYGKERQDEMAKEMMALYAKEKVSPASSCLPILVQIPVFIALYQALSKGLDSSGFDKLYAFVQNPGTIETSFFGLADLAAPSIVLALVAGATQYFQAKMMVTRQQAKTPGAQDEQMLAMMNKQMVYMMPALTVFLGWTLPGGLALYWSVMNLLTIIQQKISFAKPKPSSSSAL